MFVWPNSQAQLAPLLLSMFPLDSLLPLFGVIAYIVMFWPCPFYVTTWTQMMATAMPPGVRMAPAPPLVKTGHFDHFSCEACAPCADVLLASQLVLTCSCVNQFQKESVGCSGLLDSSNARKTTIKSSSPGQPSC